MLHTPFYDPSKSYEENYKAGPFSGFADGQIFQNSGAPEHDFLGQKVYSNFGIPAGPLINGRFVKAAMDKGFDIVTYKTVRSRGYNCHPWPNVLSVKIAGNLTLEKTRNALLANAEFEEPLSITNSFGVPSFEPDVWQKDLAEAVSQTKEGQVLIGSFQGTSSGKGKTQAYIQDFADTAKLVKETGTKILEVNLSCPNEGADNLLCFDLEKTRLVIEAIKNTIGETPLIIKIAYFAEQNYLQKLVALLGKNVQGISAINTIPAEIRNENGNPALPGEGRLRSGVCGHAIKWAGLEMVSRLKELREKLDLKYSIIGVGGVIVPEDYKEYKNNGANAVLSATGAMWNPNLAQEIKHSLF